jgi:hypothetical protein
LILGGFTVLAVANWYWRGGIRREIVVVEAGRLVGLRLPTEEIAKWRHLGEE